MQNFLLDHLMSGAVCCLALAIVTIYSTAMRGEQPSLSPAFSAAIAAAAPPRLEASPVEAAAPPRPQARAEATAGLPVSFSQHELGALVAATSTASQELPSELDDDVGAEAAPSRLPDRNPKGWDLSGKWSPTRAACSPKIAAKTGWLPISISEREARAGETVCALTNKRRLGNAWRATATCSTADARWTSTVRLALEGGKLHWRSERGAQVYVRCDRTAVASR